jgi:hypothetical protein
MLTVEEAGEVLRIGRSKAYAMAREWRETNGRSGLPVVDLGNVLRVPRPALEEMIGANLSTSVGSDTEPDGDAGAEPRQPKSTEVDATRVTPRPPRRKKHNADQLDLFDQAARRD